MSAGIATATLLPDQPPRRNDEEQLHRAVWKYLRWALPDEAFAYHPANGGKRSRKVAARMSALGVVAGVPDLAVIYRGRALFIELKARRGALSLDQKHVHQVLNRCGAAVMLCRSVEEVEAQLREASVPLRGSVA
jgi:hypothetical protein